MALGNPFPPEGYRGGLETGQVLKKCLFGLLWALSLAASGENHMQAAHRLTEDIRSYPKAWHPYRERAQAFLALGWPQAALSDLTVALQLRPGNARLLAERSQVYTRLGHNEQALTDIEAAIKSTVAHPRLRMVPRANRSGCRIRASRGQQAGMQLSEFHVVQVDDEPDIHEITRLAMRSFRVYGLPVRLHSAHSKAEGIEVLNGLTLGRPDVSLAAVALIDVVMETEQAGLELCDYIRNVMKNRILQIYVRTGQPGVAPERSVLDRFDIQGYLAKSEVTADKLYTVVKAGTREGYFTGISQALQDLLHFLAPGAASRQRIARSMRTWLNGVLQYSASPITETLLNSICYIADDQLLCGSEIWAEEGAALRRRDELAALPGVTLNEDGDQYFVDGQDLLIQIHPNSTNAAACYMARGSVPPPDWEVFVYHRHLRILSALWKQAR